MIPHGSSAYKIPIAKDESPEEIVRRAEGPKPDHRIDLYQKEMNQMEKS